MLFLPLVPLPNNNTSPSPCGSLAPCFIFLISFFKIFLFYERGKRFCVFFSFQNDELKDLIKKILDGADLEQVTMKTVVKQVTNWFRYLSKSRCISVQSFQP